MKIIKNLFNGIKGKLLILMIVPLFVTSFLTWTAYKEFNILGEMLHHTFEVTLPSVDHMGQLATQRAQMVYNIRGAMSLAVGSEDRSKAIKKLQEDHQSYIETQKIYEAVPFVGEDEKIYEVVKANKEEFHHLTREIIANLKTGNDEAVMKQVERGRWHTLVTEIRQMTEKNIKFYRDNAKAQDIFQEEERQSATMTLLATSICSGLFIVLLVGWISINLSRSISEVSNALSDSVNQVSVAIEQLSAAGSALSSSTSTSAASLQETVASIEELSSIVTQNSQNASQAATISTNSKDSAQSGESEIRSLIDSMKGISESSRKIEEIINVIDDIAFQTNLLALNAAVEAARAGDQGKGFAVVAEAVRTLAGRSAAAAKDIAQLIKESVRQIEGGVKIADSSGEVLGNIVKSVNQVSDLNGEISNASKEQTNGIQQISLAMNNLDQSVQTNASSAQEIASTATEIASQATQMKAVMEKLNMVVFGLSEVEPVAPKRSNRTRLTAVTKLEPEKFIPFDDASAPKSNMAPPATANRQVGKVENF